MPASALRDARRLAPNRVLDLEPRLRCRECDVRGRLSCQLGGPGIRPLSIAPKDALLRSLYRPLMFMGSREPRAPRSPGYVCRARQYYGLAA
jgi:hypothetical protein